MSKWLEFKDTGLNDLTPEVWFFSCGKKQQAGGGNDSIPNTNRTCFSLQKSKSYLAKCILLPHCALVCDCDFRNVSLPSFWWISNCMIADCWGKMGPPDRSPYYDCLKVFFQSPLSCCLHLGTWFVDLYTVWAWRDVWFFILCWYNYIDLLKCIIQ